MTSFKINTRGYWETNDDIGHVFDPILCNELVVILRESKIKTLCDFGCGMGDYSKLFVTNNIKCDAYDGNPNTELLTNGIGKVLDLSNKAKLGKSYDCVLSLEVGEHIPQEFEEIFIDNICTHSHKKLILSWAIPDQIGDGHVNCKENDYIIEQISNRGFILNKKETEQLRNVSTLPWFKNTIMVFDKKKINILLDWFKSIFLTNNNDDNDR